VRESIADARDIAEKLAMAWNPELYLEFADQRLRPALDLLARIGLEEPRQIYDLGCGPGNVTLHLRRRWPDADITGIDSSAEMLARARAEHFDILWQQGDIAEWRPDRPADLIYSNAALHWLDHHEILLPRLFECLAPGGVLAVQMPRNFAQPSHALMRQCAQETQWAARLLPLLRAEPVAAPEAYWRWLSPLGAELDIWETEYLQVLEGADAVLDWMRGTALAPLLNALSVDEQWAFVDALRQFLAAAYPREPNGATLFPFRRLFLLARRAIL
jgi:trans-aconitate 2-methyltransferase